MIGKATLKDLEQLDDLAVLVINYMNDAEIPQWNLSYPRAEHFMKDISQNALIIYKDKNKILGCMAVLPENDPPYLTIDSWIGKNSIVIHRVLVHPEAEKMGIASKMMKYAIDQARLDGYDSVKIDTHLENYKMRSFLEKNNFIVGDYIEVMDRIAYELLLEDTL